jgi:hypothetical protein
MKLFRTTLLLFGVALLAGCISEDYENCPTERDVTLRFVYEYGGGDIFGTQVSRVDLFIFDDETDILVRRIPIDGALLSVFAGTTIDLPPGTYRVVAWGNTTPARSAFHNANPGDHRVGEAYIGRYGIPRSTAPQPGDGDRLHFAPDVAQDVFTMYVPRTGSEPIRYTLPFARAYIEVEVNLVGYESYTGETQPPLVEITGASSHYNFYRVPSGDIALREGTAVLSQYVERPARASFRTKLLDQNTDKVLLVRSAETGNPVRFTLENDRLQELIAEFMSNNNIASLKADRSPRRVIPITITFGDMVVVSVTIPSFVRVPTPPDLL